MSVSVSVPDGHVPQVPEVRVLRHLGESVLAVLYTICTQHNIHQHNTAQRSTAQRNATVSTRGVRSKGKREKGKGERGKGEVGERGGELL